MFCFGTQCFQNIFFFQIDWYFSIYVFTFLLGRELFTYLPISYFLCLELTSGYKSKLIRSVEFIRYELLKNHSKKYSENRWWQWHWLKTNTSYFQRENFVEICIYKVKIESAAAVPYLGAKRSKSRAIWLRTAIYFSNSYQSNWIYCEWSILQSTDQILTDAAYIYAL